VAAFQVFAPEADWQNVEPVIRTLSPLTTDPFDPQPRIRWPSKQQLRQPYTLATSGLVGVTFAFLISAAFTS
jgi:hypothetical protein